MQYNIIRTDKADEQLRNIIFYIAEDSGDIDVALKYLDKIEEGVNRLKEFPYSGGCPRYATLRKQGFLVLIVDKHLVFYKVDEANKKVIVYAVVDGRREYRNLID